MCMDLDILAAPLLTEETNSYNSKLNWDRLKPADIEKYCKLTDDNLSEVKIDSETHICTDLQCKNDSHKMNINNVFGGITDAMLKASEAVFKNDNRNNFNMPGWNDYVSDIYESSREARSLWLSHGKPNRGPVYELHVNTKKKVKYAINFIKKNEAQLRKESLAKKLSDCNVKEFWKEIRSMNNSNTPLPEVVWGKQYS